MGTAVSADLQTELDGQRRVFPVFEVTLDGTEYRFAKAAIASTSKGVYSPYIQSIASFSTSIGFPSLGLGQPRVNVSLYDQERVLQKAHGGPAGGHVMGSTARIWYRSDFVAAGEHYKAVDGVLVDFGGRDRMLEYAIGPDALPLQGLLKIPKLTRLDFPDIPQDNVQVGQLVLGEFDSTGIENATGQVEAILVDEANDRWFQSWGHMLSTTQVWKNGTKDTANWTQKRLLANGKPWTCIEYTGSSAPTISDTVTFDCLGLDKNGDATSTLLQDPAEVLEVVLVNFVYNEWPEGAQLGSGTTPGYRWLAVTAAPVEHAAVLAADVVLGYNNHIFSGILTSSDTVSNFLDTWINTFRYPLFWTDQLKIAVGTLWYGVRDIYPSAVIRQDERDVIGISVETIGEDRRSALVVDYLMNGATGSFTEALSLKNKALPYNVSTSLQYTYGAGRRV